MRAEMTLFAASFIFFIPICVETIVEAKECVTVDGTCDTSHNLDCCEGLKCDSNKFCKPEPSCLNLGQKCNEHDRWGRGCCNGQCLYYLGRNGSSSQCVPAHQGCTDTIGVPCPLYGSNAFTGGTRNCCGPLACNYEDYDFPRCEIPPCASHGETCNENDQWRRKCCGGLECVYVLAIHHTIRTFCMPRYQACAAEGQPCRQYRKSFLGPVTNCCENLACSSALFGHHGYSSCVKANNPVCVPQGETCKHSDWDPQSRCCNGLECIHYNVINKTAGVCVPRGQSCATEGQPCPQFHYSKSLTTNATYCCNKLKCSYPESKCVPFIKPPCVPDGEKCTPDMDPQPYNPCCEEDSICGACENDECVCFKKSMYGNRKVKV